MRSISCSFGCAAAPCDQGMVGHCPEVASCESEIASIHEMLHIPNEEQDKDVRGVQLFTSVGGNVTDICKAKQAVNTGQMISQLYREVADFPLVVNGVHKKGYDVFVEVGPADHRTAAIKQIFAREAAHCCFN